MCWFKYYLKSFKKNCLIMLLIKVQLHAVKVRHPHHTHIDHLNLTLFIIPSDLIFVLVDLGQRLHLVPSTVLQFFHYVRRFLIQQHSQHFHLVGLGRAHHLLQYSEHDLVVFLVQLPFLDHVLLADGQHPLGLASGHSRNGAGRVVRVALGRFRRLLVALHDAVLAAGRSKTKYYFYGCFFFL